MAERRMFAKTIIDSDAFLEMPQSTQLLYFHLSMRADDDGFINKPRAIMRTVGCKDDDIAILGAKKFIIPFDTGVVVIKHWLIHNYIAKDRYTETKYKEEKGSLGLDENKAYTTRIQDVDTPSTQVRLGKVRLGEDNKEILGHDEIMTEDRDFTTRFELVKTAWNDSGLKPPIRKSTFDITQDDRSALAGIMRNYSDSEIIESINNYCSVKASREHEIKNPYQSFIGFIKGGVEKFVTEANPFETFRIRAPAWKQESRSALDERPDATSPEEIRREREEAQEGAMSPEEYEAALEKLHSSLRPALG